MRYKFRALVYTGADQDDINNPHWEEFDEILPMSMAPGKWLQEEFRIFNEEVLEISNNPKNLKYFQKIEVIMRSDDVQHSWMDLVRTERGVAVRCFVCGAEGEKFPGADNIKMNKGFEDNKFCGRKPLPGTSLDKTSQKSKNRLKSAKEIAENKPPDEVIALLKKGSMVIQRNHQKSAFIVDADLKDIQRLMPKVMEALRPRIVVAKVEKKYTLYTLKK